MRDFMSTNDLIDNPSPRCTCMLVLDTSYSMSGEPLKELNEGLQKFIAEVQNDDMAAYSVEVGVITAGGKAQEQLPITSVLDIDHCDDLQANGSTPLGAAVAMALDKLEERKQSYRDNGVAYYQPWLLIISDGAPTDHWQSAAARAKAHGDAKKLVVMPVGVDGADLNVLSQFSSRGAKKLNGLKFDELFQWLSASMSRVSASATTSSAVNLPPTSGWDAI